MLWQDELTAAVAPYPRPVEGLSHQHPSMKGPGEHEAVLTLRKLKGYWS